jgi:hypothetical protein
MNVANLIVFSGGYLEIGTANNPITSTASLGFWPKVVTT